MTDAADREGLPHLAERLNVLFTNVPRPGGLELYSNEKAATDLAAAGVSVTSGYIRQLRSGKRNNPTARVLQAIAKLFEVPITYFLDDEDADEITKQLLALASLRRAGVRGIVARSAGLSENPDLATIQELTRQLEAALNKDREHNTDEGR